MIVGIILCLNLVFEGVCGVCMLRVCLGRDWSLGLEYGFLPSFSAYILWLWVVLVV